MRTATYAGEEFAAHHNSGGFIRPLLTAAFGRLARWHDERMAIVHLSELSDPMLQDMGISRGEIEEAVHHGRPSPSPSQK